MSRHNRIRIMTPLRQMVLELLSDNWDMSGEEGMASRLLHEHYDAARKTAMARTGMAPTANLADMISQEIIDMESRKGDLDLCEECEMLIPPLDGGSIMNKHHARSCSLFDQSQG